MLEQHVNARKRLIASWEELGSGAPTVIALAELCCRSMAADITEIEGLSAESRTILFAARERGIFEIRANNMAFETPARFLTVFVELSEGEKLMFRTRDDPQQNIRFFDGFRQLCANGLVMHHLYHEFSLTRAGFELARTVDQAEVGELMDIGRPCGYGG